MLPDAGRRRKVNGEGGKEKALKLAKDSGLLGWLMRTI
jgi:hypothetical protein